MFERFTDRARKVMALANQEAQRFNHEYIGTEHILLGLVKEGSGVGANDEGNPQFQLGPHTTVLDDDLKPIEPGSGERGMLARSGRIPLGYYKDEEKTAETFVTDGDGTRATWQACAATEDISSRVVTPMSGVPSRLFVIAPPLR